MRSESDDAEAGYASVGAERRGAGVWACGRWILTPVEAIEQPYKKLMECAKT